MRLLGRVSKSLRLTGSVSLLLTKASEAAVSAYRAERLRQVKPGTVAVSPKRAVAVPELCQRRFLRVFAKVRGVR
jgi:hypothetical protein